VTSPSTFDEAIKAAGNRQVLLLVYSSDGRGNGGSRFIVIQNASK
jgi:hypothetical protein